MEYPTRQLYFLGIHTRVKVRVYTEKIQNTPGIFHDIPLESVALLVFIHVYDLPETTEMNPWHTLA